MTRLLDFALAAAAGMALVTLPALAVAQGTEEQQQACTPDALKLCSDTIPDIGKTTACMKAHYAQLSPRCQTAFHDATGGAKAPARKVAVAPRAHVAIRAEHATGEGRLAEKRVAARHLPEREPMEHDAAGSRGSDAAGEPQAAAGYPPFPSPDAPLVRQTNARSQIANACRAGLIDSFTCSTTVPALLGGTGE